MIITVDSDKIKIGYLDVVIHLAMLLTTCTVYLSTILCFDYISLYISLIASLPYLIVIYYTWQTPGSCSLATNENQTFHNLICRQNNIMPRYIIMQKKVTCSNLLNLTNLFC